MAKQTEGHVIRRDGSGPRGGPRPDPPARPAKRLVEAEHGLPSFPSSDASCVGHYDARKAFEAARGATGPRGPEHQVDGKTDRVEPGDMLESGVPAPID